MSRTCRILSPFPIRHCYAFSLAKPTYGGYIMRTKMELIVLKVADRDANVVNRDVTTLAPPGVWKLVPSPTVAPSGR